jgi:hypothetical protein
VALAAAGCGSTKEHTAKLPVPRGKLILVGVTKPPAQRVRDVAFIQVDPHRALRLFRKGKLDVAPVPLGDIQAVLRDPRLRHDVRITPLQAIDTVIANPSGTLARNPKLFQAYFDTADRADYQALLPELEAPPAKSLTGRARPNARAAAVAFSRARKQIAGLPRVAVRFAMPRDPQLAYGAKLLVAAWRDLGLGAYFGPGRPDAGFARVFDPEPFAGLKTIPIAWAVDAHLVSARVEGWRGQGLETWRGVIGYRGLKLRDPRRSP